jgi:hypothetical protein
MPFLLLNPLEAASLPKIWDHQPALWAITDSDVSELEAEMSWIILFFLLNTQSLKFMVTTYVFHSSFLANGCLPAYHIFWIEYFYQNAYQNDLLVHLSHQYNSQHASSVIAPWLYTNIVSAWLIVLQSAKITTNKVCNEEKSSQENPAGLLSKKSVWSNISQVSDTLLQR